MLCHSAEWYALQPSFLSQYSQDCSNTDLHAGQNAQQDENLACTLVQDGMLAQQEFERIFKTFLTAEELTQTQKEEVEAEVQEEDAEPQRARRRCAMSFPPGPG